MAMNETVGQKLAANVSALLRARCALLWVVTPEEGRVERALIEAAATARMESRIWDCITGVTDATGKEAQPGGRQTQDPGAVLSTIRDQRGARTVWILRDMHPWLKDPTVLRAVRNLSRSLASAPASDVRALIILSPSSDVPPELQDHVALVKWELPDRAEIGRIFDSVLSSLPPDVAAQAVGEGVREAAIEAAVGLSAEMAASCYAKSLVTQKSKIVPSVIAAEKKRVVSGKGVEWIDPDPRGLDAVAGLDVMKPWLLQRKLGFAQRARDFGLPVPKGIVLVGVPGCGKSLTAKATATAFECPLLRADFGAAQSKWVGESQANIRAVFALAEAVGRCVLWIDEIEKALAGATSGAADGGVASDALGTFLSWMQERKGQVFVIATANDVSKLPPELLRKGRFDELFFVDLPTRAERRDIVRVCLKKYGRASSPVDVDRVADACTDFTGAEIDALLPEALFAAFADGERDITTEDLLAGARATVPLAKTAADKIMSLREWAIGRARPASKQEETETPRVRALDLDSN